MLYGIQIAIAIIMAISILIAIIGFITALMHCKKNPEHAKNMAFIAIIFMVSAAILAGILILINLLNMWLIMR